MMTSSNGNIFRVTGLFCGQFTGPGEFPAQRPVTRSFDVFFDLRLNNAPVILSRFGRYVVLTLLTPTFRRNWCWFRLGATMCHDVLRCCHAVATPGPRHCPVSTRFTSDTGKFSYVVLRYVTLPPRCSLAAATLSYAVPRNMMKHSVSQRQERSITEYVYRARSYSFLLRPSHVVVCHFTL